MIEGKTKSLVLIWVENLVRLWFCYWVVVDISRHTSVPSFLRGYGNDDDSNDGGDDYCDGDVCGDDFAMTMIVMVGMMDIPVTIRLI